MKILILGHGRHGKDTVAEYLRDTYGFSFTSSSMFCAKKFIYERMKNQYDTFEKCYADRHNHREQWAWMIREYNTPDKSRLAREILEENDLYVGMRDKMEYAASWQLFDKILYVDAYPRVVFDDPTMKIPYEPKHHIWIENSGTLKELHQQLHDIF